MSENKYERFFGLSKNQGKFLLQTQKSTFLQLIFFCGVITLIFAGISLFSIVVLYILKITTMILPILKIYTTFFLAYVLLIAIEVFIYNCSEHIIYTPEKYIIEVNGEIFDISAIQTTPIFKLWYGSGGSQSQYRQLSEQFLGDDIGIITFQSANKKFNVFGSFLSDGHKKAMENATTYNSFLLYFNLIIYPVLILSIFAYLYNIH